jgi:hypothetical protein
LNMRLVPLTLNTLTFLNVVLDITLFGRVFDDSVTIKTFYKTLVPYVNTTPQYLYYNNSGKNAIVLTSSQCSSTSYEPFTCVQQSVPAPASPLASQIRYSVFYSFDYESTRANFTRLIANNNVAANTFEGFLAVQNPNPNFPSSNLIVLQRGMPFNSNRILPNEGIAVCYDSGIPPPPFGFQNVLVSVFIVEF